MNLTELEKDVLFYCLDFIQSKTIDELVYWYFRNNINIPELQKKFTSGQDFIDFTDRLLTKLCK